MKWHHTNKHKSFYNNANAAAGVVYGTHYERTRILRKIYKTEIWFGENQRYVVYGGFEQCFEVANTLSDMGFNQSVLPGLLRLNNNEFNIQYEG